MKKIYLLLTLLLSLACYDIGAQKNGALLQKQAIAQIGTDAIYIKDFSICLDAAKQGETMPLGRYPILLSKNITYRFNVASDDSYESRVTMELYLNGEIVASNYDKETSSYSNTLEITPKKAASYFLQFSFEGKAGCAVAVMAKVGDESIKTAKQELDILYAQSDNPLTISEGKDALINTSIDNGYITKVSSTEYIVHPNEDGPTLVTIHIIGDNDEVTEVLHKQYLALSLTKPFISLNKMKDGKISKNELLKSDKIELKLTDTAKSNYKVLAFTLSDSDNLISGIVSTSNKFNKQQKAWIESLQSGTHIYIKNVQTKSPDNQTINLNPLEVVIE